jgi:hypothetical protein
VMISGMDMEHGLWQTAPNKRENGKMMKLYEN